MNKLNVIIEKYSEAKKSFQTEAAGLLKEEFKDFFKKVPELKVIKWTQFTPYFNDGDPCVFGVNEPIFSNGDPEYVNVWGEYVGEDEEIFCIEGTYNIPESLKDKKDHIVEIEELITNYAMKNVLKATFGDHVVVTVTSEGIDIEEYEHD